MNPAVQSLFRAIDIGSMIFFGLGACIPTAVGIWWALGKMFGGVFLPRATSVPQPSEPLSPEPPAPPIEAGPYREPAILGVDPEHVLGAVTHAPKTCSTCDADMTGLEFKKQTHVYPPSQGGDERYRDTWSEQVRYRCGHTVWWSPQYGSGADVCPKNWPACKGCGAQTRNGAFCTSECAARWAFQHVDEMKP